MAVERRLERVAGKVSIEEGGGGEDSFKKKPADRLASHTASATSPSPAY